MRHILLFSFAPEPRRHHLQHPADQVSPSCKYGTSGLPVRNPRLGIADVLAMSLATISLACRRSLDAVANDEEHVACLGLAIGAWSGGGTAAYKPGAVPGHPALLPELQSDLLPASSTEPLIELPPAEAGCVQTVTAASEGGTAAYCCNISTVTRRRHIRTSCYASCV